MPIIPSPAPFKRLDQPSRDNGYTHPAERRGGRIPMAFQITSPLDFRKCLLPHALILHVNPASFSENDSQKTEVIRTMSAFVEQHYYEDLSEISADGSTGAFLNIYTGLSSLLRRDTIAWSRYRALHDLFQNNGSVYHPENGTVVLQGKVMLMYDRGTYIGQFTSFEVEETEAAPFSFKLSWAFQVEQTVLSVPSTVFGSNVTSVVPVNPPIPTSTTTGGSERLPRPSVAEDAVREEANRRLQFEFRAGQQDQRIGVFDNPVGNSTIRRR